MIIHIWKTRKNPRKTDLLFAALGLSNFSVSAYMIFRAFMISLLKLNEKVITHVETVLYGLYAILSNTNLTLNVAIAYNRFCVVSEPMRYSDEKERSRLQKRFIVIVLVTSVVSGVTTGVVIGVVNSRIVRNWIEAVSRFLAYVLLCIIYVKIFRKVKAHNQSVKTTISTGKEGEDRKLSDGKKRHEKYLMKLFLGITISFFIFNLPVMIIGPQFDEIRGCESIQGKLLIAAVTSVILGITFDPLWYFFLWRRIKKRQPEQGNKEGNNLEKNRIETAQHN